MKHRWLRTFLVALIPSVLVAVCMTAGILLSRIDQLRAEQRATAAQVRLVEARAELDRVLGRRAAQRAEDPRVNTCVRRTDALRAALFALVRTGNASMTGDPGWEFIAWQ